jgi:hypothetical protein
LIVDGSDLVITGGELRGDVALDLDGGTHDVAGADIEGTVAAVHVRTRASVLFSVSRVKSPKATRMLHEDMVLATGAGL